RWRLHAAGRINRVASGSILASESLAAVRGRCRSEVAIEAHYDALGGAGIEMGPSFRGMAGLWGGEGEAVGRVVFPAGLEQGDGYQIHPALLDACLQVVGVAVYEAEGKRREAYLPVSLDRLRLHAACSAEVWSHARIRGGDRNGSRPLVADLRLCDEAGERGGRWREQGGRVVVVQAGSGDDVVKVVSDLSGKGRLAGVVHLWSLGPAGGDTAESLGRAAAMGCGSLLHVVQALGEVRGAESPRLWVVTRGTQA